MLNNRQGFFEQEEKDYGQVPILKKINAYLKLQNRPLISEAGYCHGMVLYWLDKMDEGDEDSFYQLNKRIIDSPFDRLLRIKELADNLLAQAKDSKDEEFNFYLKTKQIHETRYPSPTELRIEFEKALVDFDLSEVDTKRAYNLFTRTLGEERDLMMGAKAELHKFIAWAELTGSLTERVKLELKKIFETDYTSFSKLRSDLDLTFQLPMPKSEKSSIYKLIATLVDLNLKAMAAIKRGFNSFMLLFVPSKKNKLWSFARLGKILDRPFEDLLAIKKDLSDYASHSALTSQEMSSVFDLIMMIKKQQIEPLHEVKKDVEKLLARIEWPQNPIQIMPSVDQTMVSTILEADKQESRKGEYSLESLTLRIPQWIKENKMVCIIGNTPLRHSIGVYRRGNHYHVFDRNYPHCKAKIFLTAAEVALEIRDCLYTKLRLAVPDSQKLSLEFYSVDKRVAKKNEVTVPEEKIALPLRTPRNTPTLFPYHTLNPLPYPRMLMNKWVEEEKTQTPGPKFFKPTVPVTARPPKHILSPQRCYSLPPYQPDDKNHDSNEPSKPPRFTNLPPIHAKKHQAG